MLWQSPESNFSDLVTSYRISSLNKVILFLVLSFGKSEYLMENGQL
jgi:hypothetical protein